MENRAGELIKVYYMIDWRTEAHEYDEKGNRLSSVVETEGEEIREYTYYDNSDRLMTDGRLGYVWDANGNLTEKGDTYTIVGEELIFDSIAGEYWLYEYDLQNRLVSVWKSDAGMENSKLVAEYRYDTDNLRIRKDSVEKGVTYFVYSLDGVVLYEENGGDYVEYVYVNGKHFAVVHGKVGGDGSEQETCYYAIDHLGSTVMMTDEDGSVVWEDECTPFGESSGEVGHKHYLAKFTGKDYDEEVALYYFNARWYDPAVGRFTSEDPVKDGLNWYVYAGNNPLRFIDLTGLYTQYHVNSPPTFLLLENRMDYGDSSKRPPEYDPIRYDPIRYDDPTINTPEIRNFENPEEIRDYLKKKGKSDEEINRILKNVGKLFELGVLIGMPIAVILYFVYPEFFGRLTTADYLQNIFEGLNPATQQWMKENISQYTERLLKAADMSKAGKIIKGIQHNELGFPIFDSEFNANLDPSDFDKSYGTHFRRVNKALYDTIKSNPALQKQLGLTNNDVEGLINPKTSSKAPRGYTWHHNEVVGRLQLVDKDIHNALKPHTGGMFIWGKDRNY